MAKSKAKERKRRISCLGVLLIVCMLLLAAVTLTLNLLFRGGKAPKLGRYRFCHYTAEDMGSVIPSGTMAIADEEGTVDKGVIVLYQNTVGQYRIARVGLSDENPDFQTTTYYLTVENSADPITVNKNDIIGVCTHKSAELGALTGFLTGTLGIIVGLILPCIVLLLYLIAAVVAAKEAANPGEDEDDGDTDLAFVKSIQKKQQQIAERDAERLGKSGETEEPDGEIKPVKQPRRYTDEEIAQLEEQEAARRAERIAAVRSHMEQRRTSDTPDGVPLYTTEVITRTHPISVPKTGELPQVKSPTGTLPKAKSPTGTLPRTKSPTGTLPRAKSPTGTLPQAKSPTGTLPKAVTGELPKAAENPAAEAPKPAAPPAPPATYEELMAMLDEQIKNLQ